MKLGSMRNVRIIRWVFQICLACRGHCEVFAVSSEVSLDSFAAFPKIRGVVAAFIRLLSRLRHDDAAWTLCQTKSSRRQRCTAQILARRLPAHARAADGVLFGHSRRSSSRHVFLAFFLATATATADTMPWTMSGTSCRFLNIQESSATGSSAAVRRALCFRRSTPVSAAGVRLVFPGAGLGRNRQPPDDDHYLGVADQDGPAK